MQRVRGILYTRTTCPHTNTHSKPSGITDRKIAIAISSVSNHYFKSNHYKNTGKSEQVIRQEMKGGRAATTTFEFKYE